MAFTDSVLGVWQLLVTLVLAYVIVQVHDLGVAWETAINDVDVYTIQDPKFWGPVTMLVPRDCNMLWSKVDGMNGNKTSNGPKLPTSFDAQSPPNEVQTNLLGHPILSEEEVVNFVAVHRCNHTIAEDNVTSLQYYFAAMSTASSSFDVNGLHTSRMLLFAWFALCALLLQCAGSAAVNAQMQTSAGGDPFTGLLNMKVNSFTSQCGLIALFIAFWVKDHYIMNYYPGNAFILIMAAVPMIMCGVMMKTVSNDETVGMLVACCGCCFFTYMFFIVIIPVSIGWAIFNLQFIYVMVSGTYSHNVDPSVQEHVDALIRIILEINVLDLVVTAGLMCTKVIMSREPQTGEDMTGYLTLDAEAAQPLSEE